MDSSRSDSVASYATPIIRYSPVRYRVVIAIGLLVAVALLVYGVEQGRVIGLVGGLAGLLLVGLFTLGVKDRLRDSHIALAREGDLLVGGELDLPLTISETTFEIVSDYQGSWVVVLRNRDATIRLGAGGWRVEGERFVTKTVVERVLLALGLKRRAD